MTDDSGPLISAATRRERIIEAARWICVLPAALLGDFVTRLLIGTAAQIAGHGGWIMPHETGVASYLRVFLYFIPNKMAFVLAGAKMAPKYQMATGIALAAVQFLLSLMTHVLGQRLAGNRIGQTNFMHWFAESAGALGGVLCIFLLNWRKRTGQS